MAGLLVSVRSAEEAQAALAGGAAIIDVKEPSRGSLGRADDDVIQTVVEAVAGRRPVSAALGEWVDGPRLTSVHGLAFVKWGLAGCARRTDWRAALDRWLDSKTGPQIVLTAYADWQSAHAPSVEEVFSHACERPGSVLLIDTHCKDASNPRQKRRPTLLDWISVADVEDLCARARAASVRIALAGSLGEAEIRELQAARPEWFAVRGTVCADADRGASVEVDKVRRLVELLTACEN